MSSPQVQPLEDTRPGLTPQDAVSQAQEVVRRGEPASCKALSAAEQQVVDTLRERMRQAFNVALRDYQGKADAEKKSIAQSALDDEKRAADAKKSTGAALAGAGAAVTAAGTIAVAAGLVNAIPVAGQVASAVLAVVALIAQFVPFRAASVAQTLPATARETAATLGSYRGGMSPILFFAQEAAAGRAWDEDGYYQRYIAMVDAKLAAYSRLLGFDLRCAFPRWHQGHAFSAWTVGGLQASPTPALERQALLDDRAQVIPGLLIEALPDEGTMEWQKFEQALRGAGRTP